MIYIITDTHGKDIDIELGKKDVLIHLGDYEHGSMCRFGTKILVKGNHDEGAPLDQFDLICNGLLLELKYFGIYLTHEPVERLPRGASFNVCGHLHNNDPEDYGYKIKKFHRILKPGELYMIEEIEKMLV